MIDEEKDGAASEKITEIMGRMRVCDVAAAIGPDGDLWEALEAMAERESGDDPI